MFYSAVARLGPVTFTRPLRLLVVYELLESRVAVFSYLMLSVKWVCILACMCVCVGKYSWVPHGWKTSQPGLFVVKLTRGLLLSVCRDWEVVASVSLFLLWIHPSVLALIHSSLTLTGPLSWKTQWCYERLNPPSSEFVLTSSLPPSHECFMPNVIKASHLFCTRLSLYKAVWGGTASGDGHTHKAPFFWRKAVTSDNVETLLL